MVDSGTKSIVAGRSRASLHCKEALWSLMFPSLPSVEASTEQKSHLLRSSRERCTFIMIMCLLRIEAFGDHYVVAQQRFAVLHKIPGYAAAFETALSGYNREVAEAC